MAAALQALSALLAAEPPGKRVALETQVQQHRASCLLVAHKGFANAAAAFLQTKHAFK